MTKEKPRRQAGPSTETVANDSSTVRSYDTGLRGQDAECVGCGTIFGGVAGFDLHRRSAPDGSRYCVLVADFPRIGLRLNGKGRWSRPFAGRRSRAHGRAA